jgi:hypothetical protein
MKLPAALLALVCLTISCASGHDSAFKNPLPVVRDLTTYNRELLALAESNAHIQVESIGIIEYPGFIADLHKVTYAPKVTAEKTILITGGVHGNEPAGSAFTVGLIRALSMGSFVLENTMVEIIPMVNPWGWAHDSRYNYHGKDINRDFASFETQEAQIVRDYLEGKSFDLVIDHHEDPSASGVYLYQYGKHDTSAARSILAEIKDSGYPLEQDVSMIILRTDDGLINAPMWGLLYMRLTKQLSITNYMRLENSKLVYTVETPLQLPIEKRVAIHQAVFGMLAE